MARNGRSSKRGGPKYVQIVFWIISAVVVLSMVISILPLTQ